MKTIKLAELENILKEEPNQAKYSKPVIIWIPSPYNFEALSYEISSGSLRVKDYRRTYTLNLGDRVWMEHLGTTPRDRIVVVWGQPKEDKATDILIRKVQEEHIQVVFLCGCFSCWQDPIFSYRVEFWNKNFEQFFLSAPTYEEWREYAIRNDFVSELVEYMDNHQELYVESPADDDMSREWVDRQWYILEDISEDMKSCFDKKSDSVSRAEEFKKDSWKYEEKLLSREDFQQMLENYFSKGKE